MFLSADSGADCTRVRVYVQTKNIFWYTVQNIKSWYWNKETCSLWRIGGGGGACTLLEKNKRKLKIQWIFVDGMHCPKSNPNFRDIRWSVVENIILQEIFRIVSRFPCYISCYIAEKSYFLWDSVEWKSYIVGISVIYSIFYCISYSFCYNRPPQFLQEKCGWEGEGVSC